MKLFSNERPTKSDFKHLLKLSQQRAVPIVRKIEEQRKLIFDEQKLGQYEEDAFRMKVIQHFKGNHRMISQTPITVTKTASGTLLKMELDVSGKRIEITGTFKRNGQSSTPIRIETLSHR